MVDITKIEKLEARIRQKPTPNDIRFDELETFLNSYGFESKPKSGGSHRAFCHPQYEGIITVAVPHGTSDGVKRAYIRNALSAVDEVSAQKED